MEINDNPLNSANRMRIKYILIFFIFLTNIFAQSLKKDSLNFTRQVRDLITQKQYATAQLLLTNRMMQTGMKPDYICLMVQNGLRHFYRQVDYQIFYLKDENKKSNYIVLDTLENVRIVKLRYPQRLLEKVISQNSTNGWAEKLLGDYYDIQLRELNNLHFIKAERLGQLEELVFSHYRKAEELGYKSEELYRWLGDYYLGMNNPKIAEEYYRKNIAGNKNSGKDYYRLAEISYQQKAYTQTYNYSLMALQNLSRDDVYLKYDAILMAAQSLKALGELDKFLYYTSEAIRLLPDLQPAYIDLYYFYFQRNDMENARKSLADMLVKNPYDLKGYRIVEEYVTKQDNYFFSDSLYDDMLVKYENWDEVLANIYWSKGNLAYYQGYGSDARKFWEISRNYMRNYLPEDSPLLGQVGAISDRKPENSP